MNRARRPAATCALIVALSIGLSGCAISDDAAPEAVAPTVSIPAALPVTFTEKAQWSTELATDTNPVQTEEGIAVLLPGRTNAALYRIALLDPATGEPRWASQDFESAVPDLLPRIIPTSWDGKTWLVVQTAVGENQVKLDVYSPRGTDDRRTPERSATFAGQDTQVRPGIIANPQGIVVSGVQNPDLEQWQAEVAQIRAAHEAAKAAAAAAKQPAPTEPTLPAQPTGGQSVVFDPASGEGSSYGGPGGMVLKWAEGVVVTDPAEDSGFGFVSNGAVVWGSNAQRPSGTDRADKGTLIATGPGLTLSRWTTTDGKALLAVNEIRTGKVLAVFKDVDGERVDATLGRSISQSADGRWAIWGEFLFGLKGGESRVVDFRGGAVRTIHNDILYVHGATAPLTVTDMLAAGASEGAEAEGEASESDQHYSGLFDAATGEPLTNTDPAAVPLFVSSQSQGAFVIETDGKTRLYSVPLR